MGAPDRSRDLGTNTIVGRLSTPTKTLLPNRVPNSQSLRTLLTTAKERLVSCDQLTGMAVGVALPLLEF